MPTDHTQTMFMKLTNRTLHRNVQTVMLAVIIAVLTWAGKSVSSNSTNASTMRVELTYMAKQLDGLTDDMARLEERIRGLERQQN